ncbi:MAG: acyl-ACP--UDP-N-acetylglucosamine O-acyltransferase [bacterium]
MVEPGHSEKQIKVIPMAKIHETAVIHPEAEIGRNVKIGPYTTIESKVKIGENTVIGPHVVIKENTTIGKNNKIYHGAAIGTPAHKIEKESETKKVLIGDNNTIRENVTINRGQATGNGVTRIGNDNFIMAYCYIGSNCQVGNNIIITNATHLGEKVLVEDKAVIAGLSEIKAGVRIGKIAMIGAHSQVVKDVPPYILADGHPARIKNINVIGLRRNGFKPELRKEIKKLFKILYCSELGRKDAVKKMEKEIRTGAEINHFLDFLKTVKNGISR